MKRFLTVLLGMQMMFWVSAAHASAQTASSVPTIRVSGQATVEAPPDQVQIDLGVVTRSDTSQRAAADNARQLDAVLTSLKRAFPAAMIRSVAYSVQPEYSRPNGNDEPRITGYTATNQVRVTTGETGKVGAILDAATMAGANQVQRIQFSLAKEDAVRAQALRDAAVAARARADALAAALNLRVVRVLLVSDDSAPPVRPFADAVQFARAGAPATPIEVGPIEVSATVNLTIEVAAP
jgi:uncharacterized protein YggE